MYCPINHLEGLMNESRDKQKHTLQDAARQDLSLSILESILRYKDNLKDPRIQVEMKDAIERHNQTLLESDLRTENDKILSTSHLEKSVRKFTNEFEQYLIKERMTWTWDPTSLGGRVLKFLNRNYKGLTIGPAIGRVFMESAQAGIVTFTERLDTMINFKVPDGLKIPDAGNLNKNVKFHSREFEQTGSMFGSNLLTSKDGKLEAMFNKPADFFQKLQGGIMDPVIGKIENFMYHSLFQKKFIEKAMEMDGYKGPTSEWTPGSSKFLFKENITSANQIRKNHIIQEIKRKSRTEASKLFFDYAENPLMVQKMEQLVPFTNYMYSGVRMLSRYPKSMMFTAVMLNNLQYAYGEDVWYTDDHGEKIDAGISLRFPALAAFGLGGVGLNVQRFMQFSPANTSLSPLPAFSFLTNRDDFRYKKFYETGDMRDFMDVGLTTLGGSIGRMFKWLSHLGDPYSKDYNPVKDITETLAYIATGMPIKDKTQAVAWQAYIEKDFDALLNLSDLQLNQFFKHPSNGGDLSRKSIEAAKEAMDLGLISKDFKTDGHKIILEAVTGLGILKSSFSGEDYQHTNDVLGNMLDVALWDQFSFTNSDFDNFISKAEMFSTSKNFKHFEQYNKKLFDTYKHYGELAPFYRGQKDAYTLIKDEKTRTQGMAKMFALKYRFTGDEGMSIDEKTSAIMSGKLKQVMMTNGGQGLPKGPAMTEQYFKAMDFKGSMTMDYLNQANSVIGLQKARKLFTSLAYAQTSSQKKQEYFDLAKSVYNKEKSAFETFKMTGTPEFDLYVLSDEYKTFQDKVDRAESFIQTSYKQRAKVEAWKFDKLVATTSKEKQALAVTLWLNTDEKIIEKARDMLSDSANTHYYKYSQNPEKLSSILNSIQ